jgi:hypothetical protein
MSIAESVVSGTVPLSGGGAGGIFSSLMGAGAAAGPIGMIGSAILGGIAADSAYQAAKKNAQREARQSMNNTAYQAALKDWYDRRNSQEKRMALSNYNPFSTMQQIMPGYTDSYKPAALGDIPNFNNYVAGDNKKTNKKNYAAQSAASAATVGTGG